MLRLLTTPYAVGYGPTTLEYGGKFAAGSFVPVSGGMVDLTQLSVKGYQDVEGYCEGFVNVQTVNFAGSTQATYLWMDSGDGPDGEWYGWYPQGEETKVLPGEVTFQAGEGLWIYSERDGLLVQSSGEVETKTDTIVTLQYGGFPVANPNPVSVDLTDVYVTGYETAYGYCEGFVNVQTVNFAGSTQGTYLWMDSGDGPGGDWYGWYPQGEETPVAKGVVPVLPGQGLWAYSDYDGFYLNWPKVDVK